MSNVINFLWFVLGAFLAVGFIVSAQEIENPEGAYVDVAILNDVVQSRSKSEIELLESINEALWRIEKNTR